MSKHSLEFTFTDASTKVKNKPKKGLGIIEYLKKLGGMDPHFFDTNEEAEEFGRTVRENIEGVSGVEVEISYKTVRIKLKE